MRIHLTLIAMVFLNTLHPAHAGFIEVDAGVDFATTGQGGASWGDYDGDGDIDLFLTLGNGLNSVFRNNGEGEFDRPLGRQIGDLANDGFVAVQAVWADLNNDGHLDLYVANRRVESGGALTEDHIYINDGTGAFTRSIVEGTAAAGFLTNGLSLADYDNDGDLDVFEPTGDTSGTNQDIVLKNDGNLVFSRVEIENSPETGVSASGAWGDYDGDGDLDLIVAANGSGSRAYILKNSLTESGSSEFVVVRDSAGSLGIFLDETSVATWGDLDNDGDLDLLTSAFFIGYTINWRTSIDTYEPEDRIVGGGRDLLFGTFLDADNDGDLDMVVAFYPYGDDYSIYINNGDGSEFTEEYFAPALPGGGEPSPPAVGDFNNDGYPDVFLVYPGGSGTLLANEGGANHWLKFNLRGTVSNSSAVGAIVRVKATINGEETWQMRQVSAGGETFRVQHDMRPNFGLGDATVAEVVRIEWPSGLVQEMENIAADQILQVVEPAATPQLSISPDLVLSWPNTPDGYTLSLFGADSLDGPWVMIEEPIEIEGEQSKFSVGPSEQMWFYQLRENGL